LFFACAALLPLAGCLLPGEVFNTGQLSDHDQDIFRAAARIEDVETVDWPAPGSWVVVYGSPRHKNGDAFGVGVVFLRREPQMTFGACPRDQMFLATVRHEIGHARGKKHSKNPGSVMHVPTPCLPED